MPVPIVCPKCGATYENLKLSAGAAFACGDCGRELHVPGKEKPAPGPALPVVQPTARSPGAPPPVVKPTAPPPVVKPTAAPPVVKPTAPPPAVKPKVAPADDAPLTVPPRVAPAIQPRAKSGTKPPGPRRTPSGRGRQAQSKAPPPQKRKTRPAKRRTTNRPRTRVMSAEGMERNAEKKSNRGLILAGCFGAIALAVLILVIVNSGGNGELDAQNSYQGGYEDGTRLRMFKAFGLAARRNPELFKAFSARYSGKPVLDAFMEGVDDGRRGRDPKHGGEDLKALIWDSDTANEALQELGGLGEGAKADDLWSAAERLGGVSSSWAETAPPAILSLIARERSMLIDRVIALDPDHAKARQARGEFQYTDQLLEFVEANFLQEGERNLAKRKHEDLKRKADKNGGWLAAKHNEDITRVRDQFRSKWEKFKKFRDSPFYAKSMAMKDKVSADLKETLKKAQDRISDFEEAVNKGDAPEAVKKAMVANFTKSLEGLDAREYEAIISHPPYVLFVEKDDQWDTHLVAQQVLGPLTSLNDIFLDRYAEKWGLDQDQTAPIPVIYFRDAQAYQQYLFASQGVMNPGILAHFEPENGRLCIHDDTDKTTVMHEGVHQLFWYHSKVKSDFNDQSFWFQEGAAEWFSGSRRWLEDDKWKYELGLLQKKRISGVRFLIGRGDIYALEDLVGYTYGDRNGGKVNQGLVYAQGWMLIYFLNYFDVDANGVVKVDRKDRPVVGRYRNVWEKMLGYVLAGKDGKPHTGEAAFLDAAGVSSVDELSEMADLFDRYQRWLSEKIKFNQYKDKRLVPWDEYVNSRGQKTGRKEDDQLPDQRERKRQKDKKKD
ncbi:MAG: hypothetical protein CMJ90_11785 [Planctomycetes bacterium]|nr:hypothetical protein [Planctomycetota bacterium]